MLRDSVRHVVAVDSVARRPRRQLAQTADNDVATLKAQLAEQQKQIDALKSAIDEEKKLIERAASAAPAQARPGQFRVAAQIRRSGKWRARRRSFPRLRPPSHRLVNRGRRRPAASRQSVRRRRPTPMPCRPTCGWAAFASCRSASWMPRTSGADVKPQSQIGSQFRQHSLQQHGQLRRFTEVRFSIQNSPPRLPHRRRLERRCTSSATTSLTSWAPAAANNYTRHQRRFRSPPPPFWVDVRKGGWEFLAGQSWSMLTPNRRGISALPGDIFYSQVFDVNYMAGLTWTRQPGMRVLYHFNNTVTLGFSAENPDQYIGGYSGGSAITLPAALAGLAGTQLDQGGIVHGTPTLTPGLHRQDGLGSRARASTSKWAASSATSRS